MDLIVHTSLSILKGKHAFLLKCLKKIINEWTLIKVKETKVMIIIHTNTIDSTR